MASLRHLVYSAPTRWLKGSFVLRTPPAFNFAARFETNDAGMIQEKPLSEMTNEELQDNSTIPGWHLIHNPPKSYPRGCLVGTVVSDKMQKTINVAVVRYKLAPKVRKRMKYTRKFFAHDENEVANMGDIVLIEPCHRITQRKHFMLREIIRPKGQLY